MMRKWIGSIVFGFIVTLTFSISHAGAASDAETYNNKFYPEAAYKKGVEPSFSIASADHETINPATGDMEIEKTDLFLKGKNGFDFALKRYYTLSQSNIWENKVVVSTNGLGNPQFYDQVSFQTVNDKFYDLGAGWAFDLPYIEIRNGKPVLHYGSAGTWDMSEFNASENKYYPLDANGMKDVRLKLDLDRTFNNGQTLGTMYQNSFLILEEKDGKQYYFSGTGLLIGITDRFGNEIKFYYTEKNDVNTGKQFLLNKITDSLKRDVNFQYDSANNRVIATVTDSGVTKTVTYNKARVIDKTYKTISGVRPTWEMVLDNVVDVEGRTTTYNYTYNTFNSSLVNRTASLGIENMYTTLDKITYPRVRTVNIYQTKKQKTLDLMGLWSFIRFLIEVIEA